MGGQNRIYSRRNRKCGVHSVLLFCSRISCFRQVRPALPRISRHELGQGLCSTASVQRPLVAKSTFKSRVQLLTEPAQFDGSVPDARRLYSVIGANIGSDKAIPNWEDNLLQAGDFEKLDGYSLATPPSEERQQVQGKTSTEQRVQISSDSGESFRVTLLYTDSPQRAGMSTRLVLKYFHGSWPASLEPDAN